MTELAPRSANDRGIVSTHYSESAIHDALSIYRPEHLSVFSWTGVPGAVTVGIHQRSYAFTREGIIDYLTTTMACLYVTQCGYLLIEHLLRDNCQPLLACVSLPQYRIARDRGDVLTTAFDGKIRRKLPLTEDLVITATAGSTRGLGSGVFQQIAIDVNDGAIRGNATCIVMTRVVELVR